MDVKYIANLFKDLYMFGFESEIGIFMKICRLRFHLCCPLFSQVSSFQIDAMSGRHFWFGDF